LVSIDFFKPFTTKIFLKNPFKLQFGLISNLKNFIDELEYFQSSKIRKKPKKEKDEEKFS
jgi:hypothetical protein